MATLEDLKDRISADVPAGYVHYLLSHPMVSVAKQGFDPTTLLVLNLELAELEESTEHEKRFFINGDGCGNYLFVDKTHEDERVQMWVHDPLEIADLGLQLTDYLATAEQECRIDLAPGAGQIYICRTHRYGESVLDPIRLDEWITAVAVTEGIEHRGYREATNPFTNEKHRFTEQGYSLVSAAGKKQSVRWFRGRVLLSDSYVNREIAYALAGRLEANVLASDGGA